MSKQKPGPKRKTNCLLQVEITITKEKKSIKIARRMVLRAQDPDRIVDLNQLIVLISSTTTAGIDRMRVFGDDLWGLVGNLWGLVGMRHELRKRIIEKNLWRRIELSNHRPSHLPEK